MRFQHKVDSLDYNVISMTPLTTLGHREGVKIQQSNV